MRKSQSQSPWHLCDRRRHGRATDNTDVGADEGKKRRGELKVSTQAHRMRLHFQLSQDVARHNGLYAMRAVQERRVPGVY